MKWAAKMQQQAKSRGEKQWAHRQVEKTKKKFAEQWLEQLEEKAKISEINEKTAEWHSTAARNSHNQARKLLEEKEELEKTIK